MPTRSELLVLATCDEMAGHDYGAVLDSDIGERIQMELEIVRDCLRGLDRAEFVDLVPLGNGKINASVTPKGRLELTKHRYPPPRKEGSAQDRPEGSPVV